MENRIKESIYSNFAELARYLFTRVRHAIVVRLIQKISNKFHIHLTFNQSYI